MYRVIKYFTDLQDNKQPYNPGDEFPRDGLKVSQKRLDELASNKNKRGEPLIEFVPDTVEDTEDVEIVEQPEQKEPKKRKSGKEATAGKEE